MTMPFLRLPVLPRSGVLFTLLSALLLMASACTSYEDAYEEAVYDLEPVYCYRSLADVTCHRKPDFRDERRLVNYYGPAPGKYKRPKPPPQAELQPPPPMEDVGEGEGEDQGEDRDAGACEAAPEPDLPAGRLPEARPAPLPPEDVRAI